MKKLTIWTPGGTFQSIDVDATIGHTDYVVVYTEKKGWRVLPPSPAKKIVTASIGDVKLVPGPPRTGTHEQFLMGVNNKNQALALGRGTSLLIPENNAVWTKCYLLPERDVAKIGPRGHTYAALNYSRLKPAGLWTTNTVPEVSNFWVGVFIGAEGTAIAAKGKIFAAIVWKLGDSSKKYLLRGWGGYAAVGGGGAVSGGVVILSGFKTAKEMENKVSAEIGLSITVGPGWSDMIKAAGKYGPALSKLKSYGNAYDKIRDALQQYAKQKKIYDEIMAVKGTAEKQFALGKKFVEIYKQLTSKSDFQKGLNALNDVELAKTLLTCGGFDGTKQGMDFVGFSAGEELSAYAGYKAIEMVAPLDSIGPSSAQMEALGRRGDVGRKI